MVAWSHIGPFALGILAAQVGAVVEAGRLPSDLPQIDAAKLWGVELPPAKRRGFTIPGAGQPFVLLVGTEVEMAVVTQIAPLPELLAGLGNLALVRGLAHRAGGFGYLMDTERLAKIARRHDGQERP